MNELKKSWCQRCINHLCRWFNRNQRSDRSSFPKTEYQRCIVHQVRNTLKYVPDKDRKSLRYGSEKPFIRPQMKRKLWQP